MIRLVLALVVLALIVVGVVTLVVVRRRRPPSFEDGMASFRKGLDALDPAKDPLKKSKRQP